MAGAENPLLQVDHLSMRFGGLTAVNDVSFNVRRGEITALIGPNGAGKTTLFNCVTGFYRPTEGRLVFARDGSVSGEEIERITRSFKRSRKCASGKVFLLERMRDSEIAARARISRSFQNIRLFAGMTVFENLLVARHRVLMRASGFSVFGLLGLPAYGAAARQAEEKAARLLDMIGLLDRADDLASALPYGAQRRLEIMRAVMNDPVLLCLDEPAAGLNPRESQELTTLLHILREEFKISILLIEHDMSVVMKISDHIVVLDYGIKIADGTPRQIREDPKVIAAYLGAADVEEALHIDADFKT